MHAYDVRRPVLLVEGPARPPRSRWVFAVTGVLAGIVLEFAQHFWVRGRTGSLDDLLSDAAGIAVVLIFLESRRNTV
ncbi:MAG: hypothetical protein U0835_27540 [Isosphaeraceae bacterium]